MDDENPDRRDDGTVNAACICWRILIFMKMYWRVFVMIIAPVVCSTLFLYLGTDKKFRCMFVICLMAIYWLAKPIPAVVTSMIPIVLFPALGVLSTEITASSYFEEPVAVVVGGVMFAVAVEHSKLHDRIAYKILLLAGPSHRKLLLGLTIITAFISMWVPNTDATTMVMPIVAAIIFELETSAGQKAYKNTTIQEVMIMNEEDDDDDDDDDDEPVPTNTTLCYYLTAAYASSLGGVGMMVGTVTNLAIKGIYEDFFEEADLGFAQFMFFGVPQVIITCAATYIWLNVLFMGMFRPNSELAQSLKIHEDRQEMLKNNLKKKYNELGPILWVEIVMMGMFCLMIALYAFRNPGFIKGYVMLFNTDLSYRQQHRFVEAASAIIFCVIILFLLPQSWNFIDYCRNVDEDELSTVATRSVITWKHMQKKMPWDLIFLIGSGFALAEGGKESGMSDYIAWHLSSIRNFNPELTLLVLIAFSNIMTEFASNIAVANILLPIVLSLAREIEIHPLYLLLPVGISCSYSFMLPVGTPPNAIVQDLGHVPTEKMVLAGIGPSIFTIFELWAMFYFLGPVIWPEMMKFPSWAAINSTTESSK